MKGANKWGVQLHTLHTRFRRPWLALQCGEELKLPSHLMIALNVALTLRCCEVDKRMPKRMVCPS